MEEPPAALAGMSKDIEYIKASVDEIKASLSSQNQRIYQLELSQQRHNTYFALIASALALIVTFLAGAASGLIGLFR